MQFTFIEHNSSDKNMWLVHLTSYSVLKAMNNGWSIYSKKVYLQNKVVFNGFRQCLRESEPALLVRLAFFAKISPPCEISCDICFRLHERRTSLLREIGANDHARSRTGGLEIFHVRNFPEELTLLRNLPGGLALLGGLGKINERMRTRSSPVRWGKNSALLLGLPRGPTRLQVNTLLARILLWRKVTLLLESICLFG